MSAMSDVYSKARREIIALFRWDADKLSPDQTLRLDCAVALRLALDDLQGRVVRNEGVDVAKMLTAADALSRLLPPAALAAPPEEPNGPSPQEIMLETYMAMRKRGELFDGCSTFEGRGRRIAELEARVAELEGALAGSVPLPPNAVKLSLRSDNPAKVITPPTSDIVPACERAECDAGPRPGPDDPPRRSPVVIDGKVEQPPRPLRIGEQWDPVRGFRPIPPQPNAAPPSTAPSPPPAAASGYDYDRDQSWRDYVEPTGEIRSTPRGGGHDWGPV
jgi:hypothetical protein